MREGENTLVLHQLETRVTLCTIEKTPHVPLLVLYVPSVFPEGPRLSRGGMSPSPRELAAGYFPIHTLPHFHHNLNRALVSNYAQR